MSITITATDVQNAGDLSSSDYPSSELQFEIHLAEAVVNDELAPHTDNTTRLELTAALLAAAYASEERRIASLQQRNRQLSFNSEDALSLWRQAKQADPTGRLETMDDPAVPFRAL